MFCLYDAILGLFGSYSTSLRSSWTSIGFTAVRNTDYLFLLLLRPPGISPRWIMECISKAFPMWLMYSVKSPGNSVLSCNNGSTKFSPEYPWFARKSPKFIRKNSEDSSSIEISFSLLLLLPKHSPKYQLSTAKYHQFLPWISRSDRQLSLLRFLLEEMKSHVAMFWSWFLTLQNNDDRMVVDQRPSISLKKRNIDIWIHNRSWLCFSLCHWFLRAEGRVNILTLYFLWLFCDVFVDTKLWIYHDINVITSFVKIEFHIQDKTDLCIWTNPSSWSSCFKISRLSVLSTCCLHNRRSFFNCNEELYLLDLLQETSIFAQSWQFLIINNFCEFPFVILQQVSLCQWCWTLRYGVGIGNLSRYHQRFRNLTFIMISWIWI